MHNMFVKQPIIYGLEESNMTAELGMCTQQGKSLRIDILLSSLQQSSPISNTDYVGVQLVKELRFTAAGDLYKQHLKG